MIELSKEQAAAVYTKSDRALVLAGAGSGKTRVLTARIQHLIEDCKASPHEILSFTFTRKAAGEMKERLETVIGPKAHHVTMGTMHGVALNMLQRFGEYVGLKPGRITVYSSWEEQYLLKDVAMELGHHNGKAWKGIKKRDVDSLFHLYYTACFRDRTDNFEANEIMDAFFSRCKENNALTYGMILTYFRDLLPHISKMLNIRYVLIDEVQDNDLLQWDIVNQICRRCNALLFAVGDIDQSIYAFRGADPQYLVRNQNYFNIYRLQTNYRSDPYVVEAANSLIKHNINRLEKTMKAFEDPQTPVQQYIDMDSAYIVELIRHLNRNGPDANRAVLARNHFMLDKLSNLLTDAGIKHEHVGKKTALTRSEEFRKFHAFLKLVVNPYDNFSFLLTLPYLGISREKYRAIRVQAVQEYKSHFQVWCEREAESEWEKWFKASGRGDISTALDWLKNVEFDFDTDDIFSFVHMWVLDNYDKGIDDYLAWLATYDLQDEMSEDPKYLQLMTIHASKGLEWPTVIIAGLNEGIFPSKHAQNSMDELESERRLAYVAFTRAMDQLILTSRPMGRDEYGRQKNGPLSRFILESMQEHKTCERD